MEEVRHASVCILAAATRFAGDLGGQRPTARLLAHRSGSRRPGAGYTDAAWLALALAAEERDLPGADRGVQAQVRGRGSGARTHADHVHGTGGAAAAAQEQVPHPRHVPEPRGRCCGRSVLGVAPGAPGQEAQQPGLVRVSGQQPRGVRREDAGLLHPAAGGSAAGAHAAARAAHAICRNLTRPRSGASRDFFWRGEVARFFNLAESHATCIAAHAGLAIRCY